MISCYGLVFVQTGFTASKTAPHGSNLAPKTAPPAWELYLFLFPGIALLFIRNH
jgi:hypothetical protein